MVCVNRHQQVVPALQQSLKVFVDLISKTDSLERLLSIAYKSIQFYAEVVKTKGIVISAGLSKLNCQLEGSVEILAGVQIVSILHELTCRDVKGLYLFQSACWQKSAGRIFLLCYYLLADLKFYDKFGFIRLGKIAKAAICHFPVLSLIRKCCYVLYRICAVLEGVKTKNWWKVALSICKIFIVIFTIIVTAQGFHTAFCISIISLDLTLDCVGIAKKVGLI